MGGELVSGSNPADGEERQQSPSAVSYSEIFKKQFPYYLAIGMSAEEYWNGDSELAKFYREAWSIKQEIRNQELWLQGMYIYEAICDVAPILRAFSKATRPRPYSKAPYPMTDKEIAEERKTAKANYDKMASKFMSFVTSTNKRMNKGGDASAGPNR